MKRVRSNKELPDSALKYVLEAFIPYTEANLKLAFKPNLFFNDLENIDRQKAWQRENQKQMKFYKRESIRTAFYRAKRRGFIVVDEEGIVRLTENGRQQVRPYRPKKLNKAAQLMVIFDIPEDERVKRRLLRMLLKELKFKKIQQSVWTSEYDHRELISSEIMALNMEKYVYVYECARVI